ncbi:T9SS type A sorting domain-containing protein [Aequorivita sp. H23M31]|uniref:T9SS type A sorting domain-containing protein n=1 Tax=Aequorivita ciconiae TaxID=2494375 RepID=A0A410G6U7_9FLAO|nr:M36 family metallopeptidase [Aequorivita sp. H23M31]QAA82960.1 T9SS type A sorting domain-containing protein [Aequorivita sp. H23M31]
MKKNTFFAFLTWICIISSPLAAQNFSGTIQKQLNDLVENGRLQDQDTQWLITSESVSRVSGIQHLYFVQSLNDLEIYGTDSGIHISQNGEIVSQNNKFIKNTANLISGNTSPQLTAAQAVQAAASRLNYRLSEPLQVLTQARGASAETLLSDGGISKRPIPAKLVYAKTDNGQLVLAWDLSIESVTETAWWSVRIDASTGAIVNRANWISSCNFEHDHSDDIVELDYNANLYDIPNYKDISNDGAANCTECYEVFALPLESPYYGIRTIESQPANTLASPYGWHDTNGIVGAEHTVTRGNNVNAYEDGDNYGYQPNGGANLDFTGYPFSQNYSPSTQYEDAAITNLFYICNVFHDIMYQFGFDEISGNFQHNNYGRGGLGNDSVKAEAQDGSGTCNANFGTGPDGEAPTMQMYICNDKDGDFDALVIMHEYGHGVSVRLTGGAGSAGCLNNNEQMGEGWSDFFGTLLTMKATDQPEDPRAVGTYLFGQGINGGGIRDYPYSTDMSVNPQTYDFIKTAAVPHGVGSVWAQMLWEMTWGLIDAHGFDSNPYNFTGNVNVDKGNTQALALVTEGLKLQPCSPGFIDGRDAILAADQAIYGGANQCIIWDAFAKRGLGASASQGSSMSVGDGVQAFDTPSQLAALSIFEEVCISAEIMTGLRGGTPYGGIYSGPGVTDDGNGSSFSFNPTAAGVGVHTITYNVPAGPCSAASSAIDTVEVLAIPDGPSTTGVTNFCMGESVTVTATPVDPSNVIRWYDAATGGNFLSEGTSYTFTPTASTDVYALETPPGPLSQLVVSEIGIGNTNKFEIQNVGIATDYTGYKVAISGIPFFGINFKNSIVKTLGNMAADSVVDYNDNGGAGYWGSFIWWDSSFPGWIVIIDPSGNVVDSVFWNYSASQIASFNVEIGGFNITAANLDWIGMGATLSADCGSESFRRHGDTNTAADWPGLCETADFGIPNTDIDMGPPGCIADRSVAVVSLDSLAPVITCPANISVSINTGAQYTIPDFTATTTVTDNCPDFVVSQSPVAGSQVGLGVTTITMTATDSANNSSLCTFTVTVDDAMGISEAEFSENILLYPNPTTGLVILKNKTSAKLQTLRILDVNGRVIKTLDISSVAMETTISLETLASGMYFVEINTATTSIVKNIVRQ